MSVVRGAEKFAKSGRFAVYTANDREGVEYGQSCIEASTTAYRQFRSFTSIAVGSESPDPLQKLTTDRWQWCIPLAASHLSIIVETLDTAQTRDFI